jgi:hypothetical protein
MKLRWYLISTRPSCCFELGCFGLVLIYKTRHSLQVFLGKEDELNEALMQKYKYDLRWVPTLGTDQVPLWSTVYLEVYSSCTYVVMELMLDSARQKGSA